MRMESQIRRAMGQLQRSYDDANRKNRELDAKIDELKNAKRYAVKARDAADDAQKSIKRLKASEQWKGKRRSGFDNRRKGVIADKADNLVKRTKALIDDIDGEIRRLRSQQDPFVKIISSFSGAMNGLKRELNKALSQNSGEGGAW